MRFVALLLIFAGVISSAGARAAVRPRYGGVLRLAFAEPLRSIAPGETASVPEDLASRCVYETLPTLSRQARPAEGGARWIFVLADGILFHDGSRCDAEAVVASLSGSLRAHATFTQAADTTEARIASVRALSANEVEVALSMPSATPPAAIDDPSLAVSSSSGAGTGPFRLMRLDADAAPGAVVLRLAAFEDDRAGRPFVDAIEFVRANRAADERRLFADGAADIVTAPAPAPGQPPSAGPEHTIASPESALVSLRLPSPLPVFAGSLPRIIDPQAMIRFLPPGFSAARDLKGDAGSTDQEKVPEGAACAVSAPSGVPELARVAERVQVDLLDAGIAARLVAGDTLGALAVIESCARQPAAGTLPLLRHARTYSVSNTLMNVEARGCGLDLAWAWRREP